MPTTKRIPAVSLPVFKCCVALLLCVSCTAHALTTLEKVTKFGVLSVGYQKAPPFSYLGKNNQPVGYSIDICTKVIESITRTLKIQSGMQIKFVPVNLSTRITALESGEIDLECSNSISSKDLSQRVAFTIPTFVATTQLMVRAGSGIESIHDLSGKTVVTPKGAGSEQVFNQLNKKRSLNATLVTTKEIDEAFAMLDAGKADAFIMEDVFLHTQQATAKDPSKFVILSVHLTTAPLSIIMRKDDPKFKELVDAEVTRMIVQGEINPIYRKWFESPIPPNNINLALPMNYLLRESFKAPADWVPN